jgi:hypothetical protein
MKERLVQNPSHLVLPWNLHTGGKETECKQPAQKPLRFNGSPFSRYGQIFGLLGHGNEPSGSIKCR